jgi:hypothetical protein
VLFFTHRRVSTRDWILSKAPSFPAWPRRLNAADFSTIDYSTFTASPSLPGGSAVNPRRFIPHTDPIDGFVTAQQVRDIRAHLRRMSEQYTTNSTDQPISETKASAEHPQHRQRVDTEHRGVTGTLILTDVLDDKVSHFLMALISVCKSFPS